LAPAEVARSALALALKSGAFMSAPSPFAVASPKRLVKPLVRAARSPRQAVPFLEPSLPPLDEVLEDLMRIYEAKVFSNSGPFERRLAERLAAYLGVGHCLPVANATLGLMIAMKAMARPVPQGLAVMPAFTFAATALAAEWAQLVPAFCDVDGASWQAVPDRDLLARHRDRISLIVICNTFGAPADIDGWKKLALELGVPLLVDSAPSLGARYPDGRMQGAAGAVEVFSMHATKPFAIGEGGAIVTDDAALAERMRRMRSFSFDEHRVCGDVGLNAKLSELHAAIGCRVLDRYAAIIEHRRRRAGEYIARLSPLGFTFQKYGELSAYQFVPAQVPYGVDASALRQRLSSAGVETRDYFAPSLHRHPHFVRCPRLGSLRVSDRLAGTLISLPMSNHLNTEDVDRVCDAITTAISKEA
jgi:dTDP-4-amino-4,6-dideoxygalactose transaminase